MIDKVQFAPPWATERLEKFGANRYGEPNFRVIWGPSRMHIVGGEWGDNGKSEYRRVPRYGADPKWIMERWAACPYTPEQWATDFVVGTGRAKDNAIRGLEYLEAEGDGNTFFAIGPYPAKGDYVSVAVFSLPGMGAQSFVPLEPSLVEGMAYSVLIGRVNSVYDIRRARRAEVEAKSQAADRQFDEQWGEKQHQHKGGLTIGAHAKYNQQEEIDTEVRKLERWLRDRGGKLPVARKGFSSGLPN